MTSNTVVLCACGSKVRSYINRVGRFVSDKCNVHGEKLKVTHAEIDAYCKKKRGRRYY